MHVAAAARVPEGPGGGRRGGALDDAESEAPLEDASPEDVAERLDAFGAVLVPAGARDAFRGDLSPTAIMRGIMREVFGLNLPAQREPSFWSPDARLFDLTRVPDEAQP